MEKVFGNYGRMERKPFVLRLDDDLSEYVDDWRIRQRPVPSKADAIRQMIRDHRRATDLPSIPSSPAKPTHQT